MEVYLVGGAVRDELLGLPIKERDWVVVGATPEDMLDQGYRQVGRDFPVFLHPETGEEYALARTERKVAVGHRGFICHTGPEVTLEQDLKRRDLTVNAIARDATGTLIDPWNGMVDLENRVLRHVSDAFCEDPLRVFRVARFAAKLHPFGFQVYDATLSLMAEISLSGELDHLSPERVWQELVKALETSAPWRFFQVLDRTRAISPWFVELASQVGALSELWQSIGWQKDEPSSSTRSLLRYLSIGWLLDAEPMNALSRRLRAPNEYLQMAAQIASYGHDAADWTRLPAEALLECIAGLGGLRKQQSNRFETLLAVVLICARAHGRDADNDPLQGLSDLSVELRGVGIASLTPNSSELTGIAVGEAIRQRRLKQIERFRRERK